MDNQGGLFQKLIFKRSVYSRGQSFRMGTVSYFWNVRTFSGWRKVSGQAYFTAKWQEQLGVLRALLVQQERSNALRALLRSLFDFINFCYWKKYWYWFCFLFNSLWHCWISNNNNVKKYHSKINNNNVSLPKSIEYQ